MSERKPTLPEYVRVCPLCEGGRVYPLNTFTPCEMCGYPGRSYECAGYVYKATAKPVPQSVVAQIAILEALIAKEGAG